MGRAVTVTLNRIVRPWAGVSGVVSRPAFTLGRRRWGIGSFCL